MPEIPNLRTRLSEVKRREAITVPSDLSMSDAAKKMNERNLDAVFVELPDRKYSIITKNDFVRLAEKNTSPVIPVEKIASKRPLVFAFEDEPVVEAIIKMTVNKVKHLPIVSRNGKIQHYTTQEDFMQEREFILGNMCSYKFIENKGETVPTSMPTGTIAEVDDCHCAILLFEASDELGRIIDRLTGGYGYSHVAIDCCEIEQETGKRLMIEATGSGVERSYQDRYGDRRVERIVLNIDNCDDFCNSVKAKIGQSYDITEAITMGLIDSDNAQICSGLAKNGLIDAGSTIIEEILRRKDQMTPGSVIDHGNGRVFISPNGFAEYFGAPRLGTTGGGNLIPDMSWVNEILENFGCPSQVACYRIEIRAQNIQITNIQQHPQIPGGCLFPTDSNITSSATERIQQRINRDIGEDCPEGCGCLSFVNFGPLTISHYREHKRIMLEHFTGWYNLCEIEFDIDFDIVATGRLGVCIRSD